MAAVQGPVPNLADPREAVAEACARQGVESDHVEIEPLDSAGTRVWRWHLTDDAPEVELRDVWVFETVADRHGCPRATGRAHHPRLTQGVAIEVDDGYLVGGDDEGEESVEDLIGAGMREAQTTTRARRRTR